MAWTKVLEWQCPHGHVAVVRSIHQSLESPDAYGDCDFGIEHQGSILEWWDTEKAEITACMLFLYEQEYIRLMVQNNGLVDHYCDAEFTGYVWPQLNARKGQLGVTPKIGLSTMQPIRVVN